LFLTVAEDQDSHIIICEIIISDNRIDLSIKNEKSTENSKGHIWQFD